MDITALNFLAKLFSAGAAWWKAVKDDGFNESEISALSNLLTARVGLKEFLNATKINDAASSHAAIFIAAFGEAFQQQWAAGKGISNSLAPKNTDIKWYHFYTKSLTEIDRIREVATRIHMAVDRMNEQDDAPSYDFIGSIIKNPLNTPYYKALWWAFTNTNLDRKVDSEIFSPFLSWINSKLHKPATEDSYVSMLDVLDPKNQRTFEKCFLQAYTEALHSNEGAKIRGYLSGLEIQRKELLKEFLLSDMCLWHERNIFSNEHQKSNIPNLSLTDIYVAPNVQIKDNIKKQILIAIREQLESDASSFIVISGDFGQGKSLTAKILSSLWAREYMERDTSDITKMPISTEKIVPFFIKCPAIFTSSREDPSAIIVSIQKVDLGA